MIYHVSYYTVWSHMVSSQTRKSLRKMNDGNYCHIFLEVLILVGS
jgi:hypothetical protein